MVAIHFRIVRKKYKGSIYQYEEASMNFPKELHDFLLCLRDRQLEVNANREGKTTHIILIDKQQP